MAVAPSDSSSSPVPPDGTQILGVRWGLGCVSAGRYISMVSTDRPSHAIATFDATTGAEVWSLESEAIDATYESPANGENESSKVLVGRGAADDPVTVISSAQRRTASGLRADDVAYLLTLVDGVSGAQRWQVDGLLGTAPPAVGSDDEPARFVPRSVGNGVIVGSQLRPGPKARESTDLVGVRLTDGTEAWRVPGANGSFEFGYDNVLLPSGDRPLSIFNVETGARGDLSSLPKDAFAEMLEVNPELVVISAKSVLAGVRSDGSIVWQKDRADPSKFFVDEPTGVVVWIAPDYSVIGTDASNGTELWRINNARVEELNLKVTGAGLGFIIARTRRTAGRETVVIDPKTGDEVMVYPDGIKSDGKWWESTYLVTCGRSENSGGTARSFVASRRPVGVSSSEDGGGKPGAVFPPAK